MDGETTTTTSKFSQKIVIAVAAVIVLGIVTIALRGGGSLGGVAGGKGKLVGVATADGAIYFGELVLADAKSVVLRNVYTSGGYTTPEFTPEAGRATPTPVYRVNPANTVAAGPGVGGDEDTTMVISRSRVLFMSSDLAGFATKAIRNWKPTPSPTPPPTPEPTPVSTPGEEEAVGRLIPIPTPTEEPTPEPTGEPVVSPQATSRPRI